MGVPEEYERLELLSTIGFNGKVHRGLIVHPDRYAPFMFLI